MKDSSTTVASEPKQRKPRRKRGTGRGGNKHNVCVAEYVRAQEMLDTIDQYRRDNSRDTLACLVSKFFCPLVEGVVRVLCYTESDEAKMHHVHIGIARCIEAIDGFKPGTEPDNAHSCYSYFNAVAICCVEQGRRDIAYGTCKVSAGTGLTSK